MASTKRRQSRPKSNADQDYDDEATVCSDWSDTTKPVKRRRTAKKQPSRRDKAQSAQFLTNCEKHPVSRHSIKNAEQMRMSLLDWYDQVHDKRSMPWRKRYDPTLTAEQRSQRAYEVWISEIMLQQTQVATVIPYYDRWMTKFPTIHALANSDIESVNAIWKGLGYYSRAARLLSGAQKIVKEYGGLFPDNAKDMMANISGIGRYSAGAISSIAYNHCEPVLDGNVNRLLSRVLALYANPKGKSTLDVLWAGATAMIKKADRPGDINQSLIELGATVCKPRDPNCESCPLRTHCGAYLETQHRLPENQDIEELCALCEDVNLNDDVGVIRYPMKVERKKAREEIDAVSVVEWCSPLGARHFLLVRRPEQGLLAGLHEFPTRPDVKDSDSPTAMKSIGLAKLKEMLEHPPIEASKSKAKTDSGHDKLRITKIKPAGDVLHVFSHIRKTYRVQWILLKGGDDRDPEEPPCVKLGYIAQSPLAEGKGAAKGKKPKKDNAEKARAPRQAAPCLRWVKYDDVQEANIGTGILKVWSKVNELW